MCCKDLITTKMNLAVLLTRLEKLSLRKHRDDYDYLYDSCPKSGGDCHDESLGDECNCGADEHNREVEQLITQCLKTIKEM